MAKSIQERVRVAIAKREKDAKAAEYKAGEHDRRSSAARFAAQARKDERLDAVVAHRVEPRTKAEYEALDRADYDIGTDF